MTQSSRFENEYRKTLARMIGERSYMVEAIDTRPENKAFPSALETIEATLEYGRESADIMIVLQPLRNSLEKRAVRRGLSEHNVAEIAAFDGVGDDEGDDEERSPYHRRRGHFEDDLISRYVPQYLDDARDGIKITFRTHVARKFIGGLRQRVRRDKRRIDLVRRLPVDPRSQLEIPTAGTESGGVTSRSAYGAQWTPSPVDVRTAMRLIEDLERMLSPLALKVARILMGNEIHHGDKQEIAAALGATSPQIAGALNEIAAAFKRVRPDMCP